MRYREGFKGSTGQFPAELTSATTGRLLVRRGTILLTTPLAHKRSDTLRFSGAYIRVPVRFRKSGVYVERNKFPVDTRGNDRERSSPSAIGRTEG